MCGIAGIYGPVSTGDKESALDILSDCLAHRGPDGTGRYIDDNIALLHTRLSIIDLSVNGNQPLYNEDKSLVLICNGEIYNYLDLREVLIKKGHIFSSHSDSEVILHLYEEHRDDPARLLNQLTGMFAFAMWDIKKNKLFIARDRIGIKPLYYCVDNGTLIFSSEVKPIAKTKLCDIEIDHTSFFEFFLLGFVPGPNTLYRHIRCLEAGHYLIMENDSLSDSVYWDIPVTSHHWTSEEEVNTAVETLLKQIVKDHLVADVPVGTFLSAGVDSSLITALAVQAHPGILSFTASFPGEPEDEGAISLATAARLGTTHNSFELKNNFFDNLDDQFKDLDQPLGTSSALSLGRIAKLAAQQVKVVLSGDGGDELFGGYDRHKSPKAPEFLRYIPASLRAGVLKVGAAVTGKRSLERSRMNLQATDGEKFLSRLVISDKDTVLSLFPQAIREKIDTTRFLNRLNRLFDNRKDDDILNRVLYVDMKTTLIDEMLTKCDRMTMINGVEGRVPFLDHRLVELAFAIPGSYKRQGGVGKIILRRILEKMLGTELAFRAKTGFNSPLKQWISNDAGTRGYINSELDEMHRLPFMENSTLDAFQGGLEKVDSTLLFCLVCVNEYYNKN